ncbi:MULTISPECIES: Hsp20/alpha crystallin family protein [Halolamina]|jgi:HSP20 family protein|uniref:Hsp20/alpha crystallin family protein n=1 Tax=Halolamina salina TaxID=1220023 RepID=A0ABD6B796_9EURY|nr:Hsp20/alpha crystallin family protein [Halolamina sediminis]
MRRDDREDPFGDIFDEIERMMGGGPEDDGADAHVDAFDEGDQLRLVADLPGAEKEEISLQCDGETLTIAAGEYRERVRLPTRVDEHSAEATFNNGVLEVSFEKLDDAADIDLS